ncbi:MAG TPA: GNAT family protein [Gemmataceae bacterium]|nr:GNAT family protein [Gemmataceae bacterium]
MADEPQHPPTIDLDGARLRPLRVADADALYAYLRDPAVTELTSYPAVSVPLVDAMIDRSMSRWAAGELSKWGIALQQDDQLVGTCGFNEWSQLHRWAELAFDLAQAHWGKGLMRQAVAAVLQWTYRQDLVNRVHAFVRVDNKRSERLLERSGFVREGCLRNYRVCRGEPHDFYIYGLLRSDWTAAQQPVGAAEARR